MKNKADKLKQGRWLRTRSRRFAVLFFTLCLSLAAVAGSNFGYLASIGPAPLRFCQPPPVVAIVPVPVHSAPQPEVTAQKVEPAAPSAVITEVSSPTNEAGNVFTNFGSPPIDNPADVVSPQMLLKFFHKGTNGNSFGATVPMDSTPPKAPDNSSKATYSIGQ